MSAVIICLLSVLAIAHAQILNAEDGAQKGFPITLPPDCIGQELCLTKPNGYPSKYIDRVARRLQSRSKRHNKEEVSTNVDERNGCTASRKIIQPFVAIYNQTRHLVIQSDFYQQTIPSVTCNKEGAGCLQGFKFSGPKPSCTTKFSTVNLSVFDSTKSLTSISVTFPVDCACEVDDGDSK